MDAHHDSHGDPVHAAPSVVTAGQKILVINPANKAPPPAPDEH